MNPAIPTFALVGTIIGSKSLTTVFGMGTGVSFQIWSPGVTAETVRSSAASLTQLCSFVTLYFAFQLTTGLAESR